MYKDNQKLLLHLADGMRLQSEANLDNNPLGRLKLNRIPMWYYYGIIIVMSHQEREVEVDVVVGGHCVDDQVQAVGRSLLAAGHHEPVSPDLPGNSFLGIKD